VNSRSRVPRTRGRVACAPALGTRAVRRNGVSRPRPSDRRATLRPSRSPRPSFQLPMALTPRSRRSRRSEWSVGIARRRTSSSHGSCVTSQRKGGSPSPRGHVQEIPKRWHTRPCAASPCNCCLARVTRAVRSDVLIPGDASDGPAHARCTRW